MKIGRRGKTVQVVACCCIVETVSNSSGHIGVIVMGYTVIGCTTIINNADTPEAMVWVAAPSKDDRAIVIYFASSGMEKNFTSGIA